MKFILINHKLNKQLIKEYINISNEKMIFIFLNDNLRWANLSYYDIYETMRVCLSKLG